MHKILLGSLCCVLAPFAAKGGALYQFSGTYSPYSVSISFNTSLSGASLDNLSSVNITGTVSNFVESNNIPGTGSAALSVVISTDGSGNITTFAITNTNGDVVTQVLDSGPPVVTYTAPVTDQASFTLGVHGVGIDDCSGNSNCLFASYPAFSNENPLDFYCDYSETNGSLTKDNDAGFCPAGAVAKASGPGTTASGSGQFVLSGNAAVPEPGTWILLGSGIAGLASLRRPRTKNRSI